MNDALCTGTEEEELHCEAAEIGEGVTALAVLSRVSSLAQSAAGPDIAQCEADSLAKISAQQPDGGRGRAKRRALDALIFWAYLLTVKRDTEKNCNQISWKLRSLSGES